MDRRSYIRKVAAASASGALLFGPATASESNDDVESIIADLEAAMRADERSSVTTHGSGPTNESQFERELAALSEEERARVAEEVLIIESEVEEPSETRLTTHSNWKSIDGYVYGEYEIGGYSRPVFEWHQEIDWRYDNSEITEVSSRYWSSITSLGRSNNWSKRDDEVRAEQGGVGKSSYRLYTSAEFAMCAGIGPLGGCMNRSTLWLDMRVYDDGQYLIYEGW